jgi:hypothetical protein
MSQYYASKPQSIYAVSVDSRSRPPGSPLNDYTVDLGDVVQRVKSIQVGSIQLPDLARDAFQNDCTLPISEPLDIPPYARFTIQETTRKSNMATNTTVGVTTSSASVYLPPTLNPVTLTENAGQTLTVAYPHHLRNVAVLFPPQLTATMVGTAFPWSGTNPVRAPPALVQVEPVTLLPESHFIENSPTKFTFEPATYLDAINGGALSDYSTKFMVAGQYTSYVHVKRPCLSELVQILNKGLSELKQTKQLITEVSIKLDDSANALVIQATTSTQQVKNPGTGVIEIWVTTAQLITSPIEPGYPESGILGGMFPRMTPSNLSGVGAFHKLSSFWQIRRPFIAPGSYAAPDISTQVSQVLSPLRLDDPYAPSDPMTRSFYLITPGGAAVTVTLLPGRYTGPQLANHIQHCIAAATGTNPTVNPIYRVKWLSVSTADVSTGYVEEAPSYYQNNTGGRLVFTEAHNLRFGLAFTYQYMSNFPALSTPYVNSVGPALGFDPIAYSGASSYTSTHAISDTPALEVIQDANITGLGPRWQRNIYGMQGSATQRKFSVGAIPPLQWYTSGVTPDVAAQYVSGSTTVTGWRMLTPVVPNPFVAPVTGAAVSGYVGIVPGGYHCGEVLQVQAITGSTNLALSGYPGQPSITAGDTLTVVVGRPWTGLGVTGAWTTFVPTASIQGGAAVTGPVNGALDVTGPTQTNPYNVWADPRDSFQMHYSFLEAPARQLGFSPQTYPVMSQVGQIPTDGAAFPPTLANQGTGIYTQEPGDPSAPLNIPSLYTAPYAWDLLAPRYILMIIRAANPPSKRQTHVYKENSFPILAKFIMPDTSNFIRITEDMTNYVFTDFERLRTIRVQFLYGDGTPVNFNGHNHTFTLLFTTAQGESDAICL